MMAPKRSIAYTCLVFFATILLVSNAFVGVIPTTTRASVALQERKWNFNEGQSPWGMKENAEVWNGRLAQMAFVVVFIQELVQGHGVIQGFQDGDIINVGSVAVVALTTVGLTAFLALKGADDYVKNDLEKWSKK